MQPDSRLTAAVRAAARGAGVLVTLVGAVGLLGWILDVDVLKSFVPGVATMKANTGLGFLACGPALAVLASERPSDRALRIAKVAVATAGLLGVVTLAEYVLGWNAGIDQLLFSEPVSSSVPHPNRMALPSAIALILWPTAVLMLDGSAKARTAAAGMSGLVAVLGFIAVVGYLAGVDMLFGAPHLSQMSVGSSIGDILLGTGLLLSRPERKPIAVLSSPTSGGTMARRLIPIVVVIPMLLEVLRHEAEVRGIFAPGVGEALFVLTLVALPAPLLYSFVRSLDEFERDRLRASHMLEAREAQYRALSENAIEAIVSTDAEGLIVYANPSATRIFGWGPEELRGSRLTMLMPERLLKMQLSGLTTIARRARTGAMDAMIELTALTRAGMEFPCELSLSCFSDGDTELYTGVMRDVSAVKRAAQRSAARDGAARALAEADSVDRAMPRLLRGICEGLDWKLAAAWLEHPERRAVRLADVWSNVPGRTREFRAACGELEFGPGEGLPGNVWDSGEGLFVPDVALDQRFERREMAERLELRGAISVPILIDNRPVGTLEFFSERAEPPDEELLETLAAMGASLGLFIERRRAQDALHSSERQLQAVLDNASALIYVKDLKGRYVLMNQAWERLLGVTAEEGLGKTNYELVPHDVAELTAKNDELVVRDGHAREIEEHMEVDGVMRTYVSVKFLLRGDDDEPYAVCGISTDITDRKQAELEAIAARDQAIAATRMKSEFLANMSHEIRTPMNGLIGMTELLLEGRLEPEQREYAELVRSSGETLVALVNDLLDLSKIEAGKVEIDTDDFRLGETIEDVCDLQAARAREKGVQLSVLIDAALPDFVRGDQTRLRQVLSNLVANAVKFTSKGEVAVRALPTARSERSSVVSFEVRDTGIGIDAEQLKRLWMPFEQADSSTTRQFGGTGLGLTIAKQLSELMGGELTADSIVGKGSTFRVTLPFEASALDSAAAVQQDERGERLQGMRLLVADDNATNRRIISHHAVSWQMRPMEAETGHEALELLREAAAGDDPFDVLVTDLHMPGMDGMELARAASAEGTLSELRKILLSSGLDERRAARRAGFDDYLPKPVRRAKLYEALASSRRRPDEKTEDAPSRTPGLRRPLVLVVEDNEVNQLLAVRLLERRGFRAEVAANGLKAVHAVEERDYDLVFMDCQMPEMDGYAATRAIREHEGEALRVPIVAMTAHSMRGDRERCLAAGMDDFLSKPLDITAFDAALERWLGGSVRPEPAIAGANGHEPDGDAALDPVTFGRLRDELADSGALPRLVEIFATQTPERVLELREAIESQQADVVSRLAHTMKGGAASLGAAPMAECCRQLEELAKTGELDGAAELVDAVEQAFGAANDALGREVAALSS